MGFAAHLGPWRLGTNKDTTGTTAATTSNMGCTVVAQSKATTFADSTATNMFAIPAGAQILNVYLFVRGAFAPEMVTISGTPACGICSLPLPAASALNPPDKPSKIKP